MVKFQFILFSDKENFKYRLKEDVSFDINEDLGNWQLINPLDNQVVVKCLGDRIDIFEGYMWDGSTVVGEYYEDECTLEASLLHDVLYNAAKNPDDISVRIYSI